MRKLFTFLFAALMSVGTMFADGTQIGDLYYNLDAVNQTAEVTYKSYADYSFNAGWDITTANIPASVEYNSVTYSVTSIGQNAFHNCTGLTSVTIPNSVTSIGNQAFDHCSNLTSVTIGNSVTSIGTSAFESCSGLTSIEIPNSVESIGNTAFNWCSGLTSITIPNSVTSIGQYAFYQCTGLTSVTIGNGVTSIGKWAFYNCTNTTDVYCYPDAADLTWADGKYDFKASNATVCHVHADQLSAYQSKFTNVRVTFVAIPAWLRDGDAWDDATKTLTVNSNLPEDAYMDNTEIEHVIISSGVTSIGNSAFYDCSLASVTLNEGLETIGEAAFVGTAISEVTIPTTVTSIGGAAFALIENLTTVNVSATTPATLQFHSEMPTSTATFWGCPEDLRIYVPAALLQTYKDAWSEWKDIIVAIPAPEPENSCGDGLTWEYNSTTNALTISYDGSGTGAMTDYDEDHSAPWISYRESITSVIISDGVTSIGDYAFSTCSVLPSIEIPNSVISIGDYAFGECYALTSIEIPNSVTSIGEQAFVFCINLASIEIPNSVISIGGGAFVYCVALTSIEIPNSVTSIGMGAFAMCGLTSIEIPGSVTSIGDMAFYESTGLETVTINATTPPTLGSSAFESTAEGLKIYVPAGSVDTYKTEWSEYEDKIMAIPGDEPASTAVEIGDLNNATEIENFLTTYDGQTIDELIIDRAVLNNMYNTLCLPLDMDATQIAASSLNGVEIREFTGASVEGTTLNLSVGDPVNAVVAGRPYFVKYSAASQLDELHFEGVTINNAILDDEAVTFNGVTFKGTFTPFVMPNGLNFQGGYLFLGQNNQLYWPGTSNPLKPFRAYFYVDVESSTPGNAPKYCGMPARIVEGTNVVTGIENAQSANQSTKVIVNGQLIIIKNDVRYNAQGQVIK